MERRMRDARQFNITLPAETAAMIDEKIRSGTHASASDLVNDSLQTFIEREAALERWLRDEVLAGHAEYLADPSTAVPIDDVMDRIREARARRRA
jgi:putative addiction module CopG family antidote